VILPAQAKAINEIVAKLNLPWRDLQGALSAANSPKVALLSIEPDAKARSLKILAEAKNSDDMFAYLEELKQQDFLLRYYSVSMKCMT